MKMPKADYKILEYLIKAYYQELKASNESTQNMSMGRWQHKAAQKAMKTATKEDFDRLNDMAEQCTFEVRNYGGQFLVMLQGAPFDRFGVDAYPGRHYPKALLCIELAEYLYRQEHGFDGLRELCEAA